MEAAPPSAATPAPAGRAAKAAGGACAGDAMPGAADGPADAAGRAEPAESQEFIEIEIEPTDTTIPAAPESAGRPPSQSVDAIRLRTPFSSKKNDDYRPALAATPGDIEAVGAIDFSAEDEFHSSDEFRPLVGVVRGACLQRAPAGIARSLALRLVALCDRACQTTLQRVGQSPPLRVGLGLYFVLLHAYVVLCSEFIHLPANAPGLAKP